MLLTDDMLSDQLKLFQIYWMKNKMEILVERDTNFLQSADGHLIIVQVTTLSA